MRLLASSVVIVAATIAHLPRAAADHRPVAIVTATASSAQDKFPANDVVDGQSGSSHGWCAGKGDVGESFTLTFDTPIPVSNVELVPGVGSGKSDGYPETFVITAGKQKITTPVMSRDSINKVALDGSAIASVTVAIASMHKGKTARPCVASIRLLATPPSTWYYSFIVGIDKAAMATLPDFARGLDAALKRCDAAALGSGLRFPLEYDHMVAADSPCGPGYESHELKYRTVGELVAACKKDDSLLARGFTGGNEDANLARELAEADTHAPGVLVVGDQGSHAWTLVRDHDAWKVTAMVGADPSPEYGSELPGLADSQVQALLGPSLLKDTYTSDARVIVVRDGAGVIAPADLPGVLPGATSKGTASDPIDVHMSRDGDAGWLVYTVKLADHEYRVSDVLVRGPERWLIAAAMWSEGQPNAKVNQAAQAGKAPALPPLAPADDKAGDASLRDAFTALLAGPLDAVAAKRATLAAIGSGPKEVSRTGKALAGPWAAAWAKHVTVVGGVIAKVAPGGNTGWVAADVDLDKAKPAPYKLRFRVFFVFDRAASGAWTLVHAHFATPAPR